MLFLLLFWNILALIIDHVIFLPSEQLEVLFHPFFAVVDSHLLLHLVFLFWFILVENRAL